MATVAPKTAPTPESQEQDTRVAERNRLVRQNVLKKVTVQHPTKVDIKPVGVNRFRVNVWAETGNQTEGGFFKEKRIEQSFYHVEA